MILSSIGTIYVVPTELKIQLYGQGYKYTVPKGTNNYDEASLHQDLTFECFGEASLR